MRTTPDRIPTQLDPQRGREEMRALVAMLTAGSEMLQGKVTPEQYSDRTWPLITDVWLDEPLEIIPTLTDTCMRMAAWLVEAGTFDDPIDVFKAIEAEL